MASLTANSNNVANRHNEEILKNAVQYGVCPHLRVRYTVGGATFLLD